MQALIDITTKCNLACTHCCRDLGAGKPGRNMSWPIVVDAVRFVLSNDFLLTLGGGEFFLHPNWRRILTLVCEVTQDYSADIKPSIITNGTLTQRVWDALEILDLHSGGDGPPIGIELSEDQWHIEGGARTDGRLLDRFRRHKALRTVTRLIPAGRAKTLYDNSEYHDFKEPGTCPCDALHIRHNGDIHFCGCPDSPKLGNVTDRHRWDNVVGYYSSICQDLQGDPCWNAQEVKDVVRGLETSAASV